MNPYPQPDWGHDPNAVPAWVLEPTAKRHPTWLLIIILVGVAIFSCCIGTGGSIGYVAYARREPIQEEPTGGGVPALTASPSPSRAVPDRVSRKGYSFEIPPGFERSEASANFKKIYKEVDYLPLTESGTAGLIVGYTNVPDVSATDDELIAAMRQFMSDQGIKVDSITPEKVAGARALRVVHSQKGAQQTSHYVYRGDRGYEILCIYMTANSEYATPIDQGCKRLIGSFRFTS